MNLEIDEVLKNIRILKVQTELLTDSKVPNENKKVLKKAYSDLLSTVNTYINYLKDSKSA